VKLKLNLVGIDAVQKILKTLPQDMRDNILYDINRAGAKIVQKEIIALSPDDPEETDPTNKIENNVVVTKGKGSRTLVQTGIRKRAFHSRFLEFGTRVRRTSGKKGRYKKQANRGKITPRPFIRRAHDQAVPKTLKYVSSNYLRIINRSLEKYAKRYR
jgi:HK97 gp10 family phage protein